MSEADLILSPEQEKELLEKYAPVLRFSAGERFFPTSVEDYVQSCDALLVFDPQKQERSKRLEKGGVHEGENDPNSYLRFVARDDGQNPNNEPTLKPSLITLGTLALSTFLGCVALWWLFNISSSLGRLISAGLVFVVSFFWSKNDRAQLPVRMVVSLPHAIVRVFEIILQDRRSLRIAGVVHFIFSFSNFILLRLLTDLSVVGSLLIAPIAALPLGVFYYALITDSAGAVVQLKSGRSVKWADEAYRKYRTEIVDSSEHVCTYYGRVVPVGQEWTVLQYFYFYAFNDWRRYGGMNLHEGDWESVTVYVPGNPPQDGTEPFGVAYSQHHGKEFLLWKNAQHVTQDVKHDEFHPVVYVALGSHANYPFADSRIDPSEMERFGLLQNTVSKLELQVRRIGLFGGRLPADSADGLGRHLIPIGENASQSLAHYLTKLDKLDEHSSDTERAKYLKGKLEPITHDSPGWVNYTGLWGDRTDVADESGPSGPRWEKSEDSKPMERTSWRDPLGWLEERKADAFESKASEDLEEIVKQMWELEQSHPSRPLIGSVRWAMPPGHTHHPPRNFEVFLDQYDESLLIFGESRDVNRMILHRLAQLQMRRVKESKSRRIPVILPLSPRDLSGTADADDTAGSETQQEARDKRIVKLMEQIAAESSALYGWPASVFYQWIDKQEFGETEGDESGVMLFIELDAQRLFTGRNDGLEDKSEKGSIYRLLAKLGWVFGRKPSQKRPESRQWIEAFRSFATHRQVIVSLDCKDCEDLGLSYGVEAQAPGKERVTAEFRIDSNSRLAILDNLTTADLKLLRDLPQDILPSIEQRKDLYDEYVAHKLAPISEKRRERLCDWLGWLAKRMQEHGQSLYQVDRMQPKWLEWPFPRLMYYAFEWLILFLVVGWITWQVIVASVPIFFSGSLEDAYRIFRYEFGLLFGGATGITAWLAAHRRFGIFWAAISGAAYTLALYSGFNRVMAVYRTPPFIGPLGGFAFGLAVSLAYLAYGSGWHRYSVQQAWDKIEIFEARNISWRRALQGAATGVLFGFILLVLVSQSEDLSSVFLAQSDQLSVWDAPVFQLADAFGIATLLGMGFYLLLLFGKAHREPNQDRRISPYRRISIARTNAIITGLLGAFCIGTPYILGALMALGRGQHDALVSFTDFKAFAVWLGLLAGILAGIASGGLTVLQHYTLRLVLRVSRRDPYNLLEQAEKYSLLVKRGRIERDEDGKLVKRGDAYEFITNSLMVYFAERFEMS